ncbi:MAG: ATP-binding cassette domain-containing protein, partial [Thomasclavelia spiroformis]
MIVWPIRNIGRILSDMGKCKVSFKRINEVLNSKQEDYTSGKDVVIEGNIEFKYVSFAYEKQKVLDDMSFKIDKGMKVTIIGTMSSGKTTLINLLLKFFDNYQGEILLDGHNLKDINITSLRSQISCVLQEPFLYAKSIKDNININEDVSLDIIHDSARKAFVHDDIMEFNNGYDTLV